MSVTLPLRYVRLWLGAGVLLLVLVMILALLPLPAPVPIRNFDKVEHLLTFAFLMVWFLGVFEVAITGLLVAFGVGKSQAAAFAIVSHVLEAFPYFVAGPLTALALRVKPSDVFFLRRPTAGADTPVAA